VTTSDELYREHIGRARRLAYLLTGRVGDADDIAHEAFLRCAGRLGALRSPDRFGAYLHRAVAREVIDTRRSAARRSAREERSDGSRLRTAGHDGGQVDVAARVDVVAALRELPEAQRVAVVLRYWAGCSDAEIARTLRCPVGTVKSRLSRALATLKGTLDA